MSWGKKRTDKKESLAVEPSVTRKKFLRQTYNWTGIEPPRKNSAGMGEEGHAGPQWSIPTLKGKGSSWPRAGDSLIYDKKTERKGEERNSLHIGGES